MYELTFTDGGFGWRSHRLNEPEQITDERILHRQTMKWSSWSKQHKKPMNLCHFITGKVIFSV